MICLWHGVMKGVLTLPEAYRRPGSAATHDLPSGRGKDWKLLHALQRVFTAIRLSSRSLTAVSSAVPRALPLTWRCPELGPLLHPGSLFMIARVTARLAANALWLFAPLVWARSSVLASPPEASKKALSLGSVWNPGRLGERPCCADPRTAPSEPRRISPKSLRSWLQGHRSFQC